MLIAIAAAVILILGPLLLGLAGALRLHRGAPDEAHPPWNWRLIASSTFLYVLAFNVTFFIQELALTVPKGMLPGVTATLHHNNHHWEGDNPLTALLQGTGVCAILLVAACAAAWLHLRAPRRQGGRLLLVWMVYNGFLQALPQFAIGSVDRENDVGMALEYLGVLPAARLTLGVAALLAMPIVALSLAPSLLAFADTAARVASARARSAFMFSLAMLPALIGIVLIVPFRVPRNLLEVLGPPVVVGLSGTAWMQAAAWRLRRVTPVPGPPPAPLYPFLALVALLAFFQLVLRPGIRL
jgi:hypothetical protein